MSVQEVAGLAGRVMLGTGTAVAVAGLLATLPRALRVRRRARALRALVAAGGADIGAAIDRLAARRGETAQLLRPWRQLWRWARHPLVVALLQWWARRRRARRE